MISIPVGCVCIRTGAYEELVRKATQADDIDAKVEAAFNRGYAEGKAAAYEEYIAGCLRTKNKAAEYKSTTKEIKAPQKTPQSATEGNADGTAAEVKGLDALLDSLGSEQPKPRHPGHPKRGEGLDDKELMKLRARGYKMAQLVSTLGFDETTIRRHLKAIEEQNPNEARKYARQTSIG